MSRVVICENCGKFFTTKFDEDDYVKCVDCREGLRDYIQNPQKDMRYYALVVKLKKLQVLEALAEEVGIGYYDDELIEGMSVSLLLKGDSQPIVFSINENSDKFEMIGRLLQLTKEDINDYIKE